MHVSKFFNKKSVFSAILTVFVIGSANADNYECGTNLFNPQVFRSADFTVTSVGGDINNGYSATGNWKGALRTYLNARDYNFKSDVEYKVMYNVTCSEDNDGSYFIGLLQANPSDASHPILIGPTNNQNELMNVCVGHDNETVTVSFGGTGIIGFQLGQVGLGDDNYDGNITISNVMVVPASTSVSAGAYIPYKACIKVATTLYTSNAAIPVETRLNDVRSVISTLIGQMETNTTNIMSLNNTKQTRPAAECASGKKCLLVKDTSGGNHWYEIKDCSADEALNSVVWGASGVSAGPGEPWGWKLSGAADGNLMCRTLDDDGMTCGNDEWVVAYDVSSGHGNELVFGTARRVAISERNVGSIVALPNNVGDGDVCVCKATKYQLWNSTASDYGTEVPMTTDKWYVAGIATSDDYCFIKCGDERIGGAKVAYYTNINNSCSPVASEVQMCRYHGFFGDVVTRYFDRRENNPADVSYAYGTVRDDGATWQGCAGSSPSLTGTGHCSTDPSNYGTWITEYYRSSNHTDPIGYVYGFGGYITVPAGTVAGDVVDVSISDVSTTTTGHNATVCVVKGYKMEGDVSDTNLTTTKAYVAYVGSDLATNGMGVRHDGCAEFAISAFGQLYSDISDMCMAN